MKKILTILLLFICLIGFGQRTYYFGGTPLSLTSPSYDEVMINIPGEDVGSMFGITSIGEPLLNKFTTGNIDVSLHIQYADANILTYCTIYRVAEGGTILESFSTGATSLTSGTLTFNFSSVSWSAGNITDRFRVDIIFINTLSGTRSVVYRTGSGYTSVSKVETPFTEAQRRIFNIN